MKTPRIFQFSSTDPFISKGTACFQTSLFFWHPDGGINFPQMSEQQASLNNVFIKNLNEHFTCKNFCLPAELNINSILSETIHHKYEYLRGTSFLSLPLSRYLRQLAVLAFSPRHFWLRELPFYSCVVLFDCVCITFHCGFNACCV